MEITNKSLYEYLLENKNVCQTKVFFADEERSYSSIEVYNLAVNLANKLSDLGVKDGDVVALRTTRALDTGVILLASEILGTLLILCDPHNSVRGMLSLAKAEINPDYIITNEDTTDDISANGNFVLKNAKDEVVSDISFDASEATPKFNVNIDIKKPALIIFTSGSTGKNKAVTLSQFNYLNHIQDYYQEGCYELDDVGLEVLPIFHVFGLAVILMGLIRKYQVYFPKTTAVDYIAELILKLNVTRYDGVPSYALALSNYYIDHNVRPTSLRVAVVGGAPSSFEQFLFIEETLGLDICPVYGMSECIAITGAGKTRSREKRSHTVGTRLPLCDLKILDDNGNELGVNQIGEVTASGPMVMLGYYKDEEETNEVLKDGRLYTGDLGFIDEEDFLHIIGRKKDIIIRNGNNISSVKIEQEIALIEDVLTVAVVPLPNAKQGEVPGALIILKDKSKATLEEIKEKITKVVSKNEIPEVVMLVKEIPLTGAGKVDKTKVKEKLING